MPFDTQTRNRLARLVTDARELIAAEFAQQLQSVYGIAPSGEVTPLADLGHLDEEQRALAELLRDRVEYLRASSIDEKDPAVAAVDRLTRELAFTVLNRLAALRMAENRGFILESIGRGYQSKGFQVYSQVAGSGLGETYHRYRRYLFCLFDELAVDLGFLFDRRSPTGLLFPRETALVTLFQLINAPEIEPLWTEDETIGWIYQYYNDEAERRRMRELSTAPRNSRELAVRNQFFTPRYVVEFLVDNTLGRIWYEARKGKTTINQVCNCLLRRPSEIFLEAGESAPASEAEGDNLSGEDLLNRPAYIPHRPKKDPRDLKILDPACGSGHFLLYSFDLLETIYEESWADEQQVPSEATGRSIREDYGDLPALQKAVPELIVRYNLHGIDIDLRACQIAALALWLRAQRAYQGQKLSIDQRPKITRSNIVCAEPMPGDRTLLQQFVSDIQPKLLGQLVQAVFAKTQLAGEAGYLLKIDTEISDTVSAAKKTWMASPQAEQVRMFGDASRLKEPKLDLSGITDAAFWDEAEGRIYAALQEYAEEASNGHAYHRRLFVNDTARGFAFVDLCRKRYDAVLMNPPFGEAAVDTSGYIAKQYPTAFIDLLAAFVERAFEVCPSGRIGALTSRACLYTKTLSQWRHDRFVPAIDTLIDLGGGVLDGAMVFACASVLASPRSALRSCLAFDVRKVAVKDEEIRTGLDLLTKGVLAGCAYIEDRNQLSQINNSRFLYNIPESFWDWSHRSRTLEAAGGSARAGSTTYDDFRFLRLAWEVPPTEIGWEKTWVYFSKGGYFETIYNDLHLLTNWQDNGREVGEFNRIGYNTDAQSKRASAFYKRPGITYPRRTVKGFAPRALPENCIFADKGPVIFSPEGTDLHVALGFWNSAPIRALVHLQVQAGSFETGVVNSIPWLEDTIVSQPISDLARRAWRAKAEIYRLWETDRNFVPHNLSSDITLLHFRDGVNALWRGNSAIAISCCENISDRVSSGFSLPALDYEPFEVSADDHAIQDSFSFLEQGAPAYYVMQFAMGCIFGRWDIRYATGDKKAPELSDAFAALSPYPPAMLLDANGLSLSPADSCRVVDAGNGSYPIDVCCDGILVDDADNRKDVVEAIRDVLNVIWKDRAEMIEHEACEILGVKNLREYFSKPSLFFNDHLKRYSKSRRQAPIYWPLSTPSGRYTLWLYYPRLTAQTLHQCIADFLMPKLRTVSAEIQMLRGSHGSQSRLDELVELQRELSDLQVEIETITKLPYVPNLNDGVLVTAAPLWKLFRLPKWGKDLRKCWEELQAGDYDWAHLSISIWPDRVKDKCKLDRSIAIAHNLENLCEIEQHKVKSKNSRGEQGTLINERAN